MLSKIVEACRYLLENYPEAQACKEYLDSRLNKASQELFNFGYFPGAKNLRVLTDMVGEEVLIKEKLLWNRNIEDSMGPRSQPMCYFEHNPLIMPYRNQYGKTVAIVGRTILNSKELENLNIELERSGEKKAAKYKNTQETSAFKKGNLLFGLNENKQSIIEQNAVYVVEGQFDVIKATEKGFKNIVALGTNSMTDYQFSVISRYTDNIFLLLDNDEGGDRGRKRIIEKFGALANIQNFYLPNPYKDIDEYFTNSGEDSVSFVVRV